MKKKTERLLLAALCVLGLWGCQRTELVETVGPTEEVVEVLATVPMDGNPEDVTCKGLYTAVPEEIDRDAVVARAGDAELTNGELAVWYHGAVAQYRQEGHEEAPDFEADLATQVCQVDSSVNSWEQYFLRQALENWHKVQALKAASGEDTIITDPYYNPVEGELEQYMTGMPATEVLYGYHEFYRPNSMHQAYLDDIPEMLENMAKDKGYGNAKAMAEKAFGAELSVLETVAESYNYSYMYFTELSYRETEEEEASAAAGERYVDIRHILLVPQSVTDRKGNVTDPVTVAQDGTVTCSEEIWKKNEARVKKVLKEWKKEGQSEPGFRELAYQYSDEKASFENGGIYRQLRKGQLIKELDDWCFDTTRQAGDSTTIRTAYGDHILYFAGSVSAADVRKEQERKAQNQQTLIGQLCNRFPVEVDYGAIRLPRAAGDVSFDELLYPDVAHERYPELPLYLQQAYDGLIYGRDPLRSHGCGITSFALLSSYMMDEEYTPAEMCEQFRRYNSDGTDGMIFMNEPSTMGYYLNARTFDPKVVEQALKDGHKVISLQRTGYWTRTGHYITVEKFTEDGMLQVRDTHMPNYGRIEGHSLDKHEPKSVYAFCGGGYWVMSKKVTMVPFCSRCGDGTETILQNGGYTCEKCEKALIRRNVWLGN